MLSSRSNSCRILLVEDNSVDIDLTRRALHKSEPDIQLEIARDGEEALEFIKHWDAGAEQPTFILLDLKLPKIDGLEVLKALKSHQTYYRIPVIVLTSSNESRDVENAYKTGVNSYILKAIDYNEFTKAIDLITRYWCGLNVRPG